MSHPFATVDEPTSWNRSRVIPSTATSFEHSLFLSWSRLGRFDDYVTYKVVQSGRSDTSKPVEGQRGQVLEELKDVARSRYTKALAAIRKRESDGVFRSSRTFLTEVERLGVPATVIAPSPEGGVTFSFGTPKAKYAFVEIYHDNTAALVVSRLGAAPTVEEGQVSSDLLGKYAKDLAKFLLSE